MSHVYQPMRTGGDCVTLAFARSVLLWNFAGASQRETPQLPQPTAGIWAINGVWALNTRWICL